MLSREAERAQQGKGMTGEDEGMSAPPCLEGRVPAGGVLSKGSYGRMLLKGTPLTHSLPVTHSQCRALHSLCSLGRLNERI